jgi:predicted ArsR family transcriptional regulator
MSEEFHSSDVTILDLLRQRSELTVGELADLMEVTPTAVRQRLNRLMLQGYVDRHDRRQSRGRPTHDYSLTASGRRKAGENFADLATALWEEVRSLKDLELRNRLIEGIAKRLAKMYSLHIGGETLAERMHSIAALFGARQIPMSVEDSGTMGFPTLNVMACPYPDLANEDDAICHMERSLLSELTGQPLRLDECSLSGGVCCKFTTSSAPATSQLDS